MDEEVECRATDMIILLSDSRVGNETWNEILKCGNGVVKFGTKT